MKPMACGRERLDLWPGEYAVRIDENGASSVQPRGDIEFRVLVVRNGEDEGPFEPERMPSRGTTSL